jgi:hypothetical protein
VFGDPTESFFEVVTKYPAPPPVIEATANNVYSSTSNARLTIGKKKEAEEIARLNDAMAQVIAKTEEYKKDLVQKKKQLDEINTETASGAE